MNTIMLVEKHIKFMWKMMINHQILGVLHFWTTGSRAFPKYGGVPAIIHFFFPVGPVRKLKMPSQEKNNSSMDVARLGFRKTNVGARKAGLVT